MINAEKLVDEIRRELAPVEQEIRRHPYLAALETGRVRREDLTRFAGEQHHIIQSDLRSIALLVNRFGATPSGPFFQAVLGGETAALAALGSFAAAVGMDDARLQAYEPVPGALAYTAFMAWLALYGSEAEVAAGFLVNFAAWGANCGRMSRALRDRYGLTEKSTAFFDLFASVIPRPPLGLQVPVSVRLRCRRQWPLSVRREKRMSVPCRFGALRLGQPTDGNTGGTCNGLTAHLNRGPIRTGVSSKYHRTTDAAPTNDH